ncbi:SCO6745 family protein [Williamsia sp. SKLECPSW1]
MTPTRYDDVQRARARTAYETLEPLNVLAYFHPGIGQAQSDTGLDPYAWYVGARGAPLGDCVGSVVSAAFFNFNPAIVEPGWAAARRVGLDVVHARREEMLAGALGDIWGERAASDEVRALADRLLAVGGSVPMAGRTLASAWAEATPPDDPAVRLWHAVSVLREWRGDGHVAALTAAGFDRVEAVVFHEASHPDPAVRKRGLGKKISQLTRGWSDGDWDAASSALLDRGLLRETGPDERDALSDAGGALYDELEVITDDAAAAAWKDVDDFDDLIRRIRPYIKAVLDAGVLPGTKKK